MRRVGIPGSDLQVSAIAFGTADWGIEAETPVEQLYATYREAGGNCFDTAHCYAFWRDKPGASERTVGRLIKTDRRSDLILSTEGGASSFGTAIPSTRQVSRSRGDRERRSREPREAWHRLCRSLFSSPRRPAGSGGRGDGRFETTRGERQGALPRCEPLVHRADRIGEYVRRGARHAAIRCIATRMESRSPHSACRPLWGQRPRVAREERPRGLRFLGNRTWLFRARPRCSVRQSR